ncbi:hypothetical protein [Xenorhabdus bovienii]|uniref:hypothetical protein n=1 Tax=Xenorhabdus bovienii TaxID=40576 RepID=UPI0023AEA276|nr:hypothetical protein [Xenorhabdus bovienii]MDE9480039.1 hypothetical protein [Xenorhabdus bovienii]MDE9532994.1 hypothetical protein [Xenorhabdus bovienii]
MSQNTTVGAFNIGIKYDTDTLNQLEAQLKHIAEQVDRINGRLYDAGMKLSVDTGAKAGIAANGCFKGVVSEGRLRVAIPSMKETVFGPVQTAEIINDDHIRQIVREELRQFVNRESRCGGLFSK